MNDWYLDFPSFSHLERDIVRGFRDAKILVDHEGRLKIEYAHSEEFCATQLHKLLRPDIHGEPERNTDRKP